MKLKSEVILIDGTKIELEYTAEEFLKKYYNKGTGQFNAKIIKLGNEYINTNAILKIIPSQENKGEFRIRILG
ncbi:hypothetical protein [Clostridium sp. Cult2]|uniref:hypothetical protein n=1 Tax=Clostridium sp. Cult2 TaxID=2079003 RepID=UPI001F443701|nr:hypothetical protein [Clostridium sp. Cult2]MCF6466362.1 hypothetical protein [Clostridium sp. Cult2]